MIRCAGCGKPIGEGSDRCSCAPSSRPVFAADLRRDAYGRALKIGWLGGSVLGLAACVVVILIHAISAGFQAALMYPDQMGMVFLLTVGGGALGGMVVAIVWQFLLRPIFLAIFASPETFQREYGTPEEQGIIKKER